MQNTSIELSDNEDISIQTPEKSEEFALPADQIFVGVENRAQREAKRLLENPDYSPEAYLNGLDRRGFLRSQQGPVAQPGGFGGDFAGGFEGESPEPYLQEKPANWNEKLTTSTRIPETALKTEPFRARSVEPRPPEPEYDPVVLHLEANPNGVPLVMPSHINEIPVEDLKK